MSFFHVARIGDQFPKGKLQSPDTQRLALCVIDPSILPLESCIDMPFSFFSLIKDQPKILQRLGEEIALLIVSHRAMGPPHIPKIIESVFHPRCFVDSKEGIPCPVLILLVLCYAICIIVRFDNFRSEIVGWLYNPEFLLQIERFVVIARWMPIA